MLVDTIPQRAYPASKTRWKWDSIITMALIHVGAVAAFFYFTWEAFWVFVVMQWLAGGIGICLCYHRLLAHRSFELWKPLEYLCALLGVLAWQMDPIKWVATHRLHHARSDQPNDPHSPTRGFWWAHIGWMLAKNEELDRYERYRNHALDLDRDPFYRFLNATHGWYQVILAAALFAWGGLPFLLWGVFLRVVFMWHATWLVNSASHIWGYRTWASNDQSTNNWWVALLTYGEGWHNNHHAFPRSAAHGLRWWEVDLTYLTIRTLARLKLVSKIQLPGPELKRRMARRPQAAVA